MFRDFSFLAAARPCPREMAGGPWPADVHGQRVLLNLCDANGLSLLPRLARAARRVQGPRSGTFRKLEPVARRAYLARRRGSARPRSAVCRQ